MGTHFRFRLVPLFFILVLSQFLAAGCKTYKRPKNPGQVLFQGYYLQFSFQLTPQNITPYVTDWTNVVHVEWSNFLDDIRRAEVLNQLKLDVLSGKKLIIDFGGEFYRALVDARPLFTSLPLLQKWAIELEPIKDAILAIQVLDEPRNWMDTWGYTRTLSGENLTGMDPFLQSLRFQEDVANIMSTVAGKLGVPLVANFDNSNDVGPYFPIISANLYSRTPKLERDLNRFYWRTHDRGQKLWVTGRAFSAVGRNGSCNFQCRPGEVLFDNAKETENLIKAYGIELVLWFLYQNYENELEITSGASSNPRLLERHRQFFLNTILPNQQKAYRQNSKESFYILRKGPDDPGREVGESIGKMLLDSEL